MKLNLFDSHVHTVHSPDAGSTVEEICAAALENGVMGVAFTDHFDCAMPEKPEIREIDALAEEVGKAQEKVQGRLRLTLGVELGQGHLDPKAADRLLKRQDFDVVLGSVHCAADGVDVSEVNFDDPGVRVSEILDYYFRAAYEMTKWGKFDVMGHFGYVERYIWGKYRIPVNFAPYEDVIQETLKLMVEQGKGLEVNTSGYRQGIGKTIPVLRIIRRYYQLGGRLVTLGSDAHRPQDVASDFDVAMDLLSSVGFEYFAFYRKREPVMLKLI